MKIYAIYILSCSFPHQSEASILNVFLDFPKKFILHKKTIEETCRFLSKTLAVYCQPGSRTSVVHEQMLINVYHRVDSLTCVVFSNEDYPKRLAYALCAKSLESFVEKYGTTWNTSAKDSIFEFKELKKIVKDFERPENQDSITRLLQTTEETKEIISEALNKIIIRGETLEDLVFKSEELSSRAKIFYKETQKKKCCIVF